MFRFALACLALAFCLTLPVRAGGDAEPSLAKSVDKIVYAIGLSVAERLGEFELDERELALVQAGLADGLRNDPKVSLRTWGHRVEGLRRKRMERSALREKEIAAQLVAQAAAEDGAVRTPTSLVYRELVAGSGPSPLATDRVKVHYHGTLHDGTVFDSSRERGRPSTFGLSGVIKCWTEGLQRMKVGGKSKLVCPPGIAYGDKGMPGKIRPGAALTFEVELLEILPQS